MPGAIWRDEVITAFHGIGAFRGQRNPLALKRAIDTALTGVEVCVADRPIRAFGIVVTGECRVAYDADVWSMIGPDGMRVSNVDHEIRNGWTQIQRIDSPEQREFEALAARNIALVEESWGNPEKVYCEAWMRPAILRAVWVKTWADPRTRRVAEIIAAHRDVPLLIVDGATRIWDVLDGEYLDPMRVESTSGQAPGALAAALAAALKEAA